MSSRSRRWVVAVLLGSWLASVAAPAAAATPGLQVTTTTLPGATAGAPYSMTLVANGGTPPYSWSVASGALPGGLVLSSSGILAGIPGAAGSAGIVLRVTDSLGIAAGRTLAFSSLSPPPPPEALAGVGSSGTLALVGLTLPAPPLSENWGAVIGIAADRGGSGVWLAYADGKVSGVGAPSLGSVGRRRLRGRIVAIAALPSGTGYYLLSSRGAVYAFGAAHRRRGRAVGGRAVGIAVPGDGRGYLVAAANGTVAAYGGAADHGGIAPRHRSGRIVGIAALQSGGYVLVSRSGRISRFGAARSAPLPRPRPTDVVAVTAAASGRGYFVVSAAGVVFSAGGADTLGALSGAAPFVAAAAAR